MANKLLSEVLAGIKPSKEFEKEVRRNIHDVLASLNKNLKGAKAILGGSGVKDTWLKDAYDADIFVAFNYRPFKDKSSMLSDLLEKPVKKCFPNASRVHGSRDYFEVKQKGFTIEIIPILRIKRAKEAMNITDVSPLHSEWVNKKGKRFKDDIRLLKQFCKAAGVYGAESFIRGFSGYACEILAIHFKGFLGVARNAARWDGKIVLDPGNHWKRKNILMELNSSKISSPIVIIDPVQADRNASAAVSQEKFSQFVDSCRAFLKKPSKKFFEAEEVDEGMLRKRAGKNHLAVALVNLKPGKRDVVGCQLKKVFEFFRDSLVKNGFKVIEGSFIFRQPGMIYLIVENKKLSPTIEIAGPPLHVGTHVQKFREKHPSAFIRNKRLFAKEPRAFTEPEKFLEHLENDPLVRENAGSISIRWIS